jgi:hypothetical protein
MTHPRIAPVNVVGPAGDEPDWAHDIAVAAVTNPRRVVVHARPGQRRPRTADLAADLLDALGRPGVAIAVRKHLSSDLTRVVPFLLTDNVTDLVVLRPEDLGREACEDVIAVAMLAHLRLWLVLGSEPADDVADLLGNYAPQRWSAQEAIDAWQANRRRPAAEPSLREQLSLNAISSDEARAQLARQAAADPALAARIAQAHGRDTLRPALRAAADLPLADARLGRLPVADMCPRAASIRLNSQAVDVPPRLRRALLRQRLHALVIGQRPTDPVLTIDGSPMSETTLAGIIRHLPVVSAPTATRPQDA